MTSDIFQPFTETTAPAAGHNAAAEAATPKKPRRAPNGAGRASRKQSAASTQTPATEPPKKRRGRQPKSAAAVAAADMGFKIDLLTALAATTSLKGEDTLLFGQMVTALQKQNKKARGRIVDALGKVFG